MGGEKNNFQEFCKNEVEGGNAYASEFLRSGKNPLVLALERARREGLPQDLIERVEEKGMLDGSFELTYEGAQRIYNRIKSLAQERTSDLGIDYLSVLEKFDPIADSNLIATGIMCLLPEVREKVGGDLNSIYKVVMESEKGKRKGYALPQRQDINYSQSGVFPSRLKELLGALPEIQTETDEKYQKILHLLIRKKAEREVLPTFQDAKTDALHTLDQLVENEQNPNIQAAYKGIADQYREYLNLELLDVNPDFKDPRTGQIAEFPLLHQKIGIYHILQNKRFAIWDSGGTGKTAIAVLAQPLIEQQLQSEGKNFRRSIVVGPNKAKEAWRRALLGNIDQRYLASQQNVMIINGDVKDKGFLEEVAEKKWIMLNYEQLITKLQGSNKTFVEALLELGVDYVVYDETQNIKGLREVTQTGNLTHSAAARLLALNSEYYVPMSGTPISNGLMDYAVQYHSLNPVVLPDPSKFMELIENSPRILYTLFHENSVRRTAADINNTLDWDETEHLVDLDELQRKIYDHIVEYRPKNWLHQARKTLLDPRLVDPEILQRAGVFGKITWENSAKFKKIREYLLADNGPFSRDEKVIIFSTKFREGVTQKHHKGLEKRYNSLGLTREYKKLEMDKTLDVLLQDSYYKKFGKKINIGIIDGTVAKPQERDRIVDGLKDGLDALICTTQTGGESMDFTAANNVLFLDEDYVPDTEEQAVWRLLRKGQQKKVHINHFRAKDTLDEDNRDYVDKKRIIAKMAMDGMPLTEDEIRLLEDTDGKKFGELVKRGIGGKSINVFDAEIQDISDFEIRKQRKGSSRSGAIISGIYDTTDAQKVLQWIGMDTLNCWKDPDFVELYMRTLPNLSPPVVHTAKICDLINRAHHRQIQFPSKVLSDGSGPSLLYDAYQILEPVLNQYQFSIPEITDRDTSQPMLDAGKNPNQVLGNMNGENSIFKDGTFDMVDNESISLLRNPEEVHSHLLEAHRVLKPEGLIELVVKNLKFSKDFYSGMENLGFDLLSEKQQGLSVGKEAFRRLKDLHGEHFAESYAAKLRNTQLILAKKIDGPTKVEAEKFWFDTMQSEQIPEPSERKSMEDDFLAHDPGKFIPEKEVTVDKFGNVISIKKLGMNENE